MRRMRRRWVGWVASGALFTLAVVPFRNQLGAVDTSGGLPSAGAALVAIGSNLVANGVLALTWRRVVLLTSVPLPRDAALRIWASSQLARYTVGAGQLVGRAVAGRAHGVSLSAGAVTTLVEIGWQSSLSATLALATLPWWAPGAAPVRWVGLLGVAPATVLAFGLVHPQRLLALLAQLLRLPGLRRVFRRSPATLGGVRLHRRDAARLTGMYAVNLVLRLVAFLVLFAALGGALPRHLPLALGAYAVGQVIGRLAVFAPGGLGAREGATLLVLVPAMGGGPALALVAGTRLLELVAELLFFLLTRLLSPSRAPAQR